MGQWHDISVEYSTVVPNIKFHGEKNLTKAIKKFHKAFLKREKAFLNQTNERWRVVMMELSHVSYRASANQQTLTILPGNITTDHQKCRSKRVQILAALNWFFQSV